MQHVREPSGAVSDVPTIWRDRIAIPSGIAFYYGSLGVAYVKRGDFVRSQFQFQIASGSAAQVADSVCILLDGREAGWVEPAMLVGRAMRGLLAGLPELQQLARKRRSYDAIRPISQRFLTESSTLVSNACEVLRASHAACGHDPGEILDNIDVADLLLGKES